MVPCDVLFISVTLHLAQWQVIKNCLPDLEDKAVVTKGDSGKVGR